MCEIIGEWAFKISIQRDLLGIIRNLLGLSNWGWWWWCCWWWPERRWHTNIRCYSSTVNPERSEQQILIRHSYEWGGWTWMGDNRGGKVSLVEYRTQRKANISLTNTNTITAVMISARTRASIRVKFHQFSHHTWALTSSSSSCSDKLVCIPPFRIDSASQQKQSSLLIRM